MSVDNKIDALKEHRDQLRKRKFQIKKGWRHNIKDRIEAVTRRIRRLKRKNQADIEVKQVPFAGTGSMTGGGHKVVWHTTEGSSAAGALGAYRASGAYPHFTLDENGVALQHLPLNQYATALQHIGPYETNRANAIQVEIVGFASQSGSWSDARYAQIKALGEYIHNKAKVPQDAKVSFSNPSRLSGAQFVAYAGHCGHVHVPNNSHYDPGTGFKIGKVI